MAQSSSVPVPPYRLETFGKLVLKGSSSSGQSHQRRRLALLALLAASGDRGLTRDQLLGYLWPESTSANARHSLDQLLHALRRAFGESIFNGPNPVSLNPEVVASDVNDFESALSRGALTDAVDLYDGEFLQGFYLDDAPEFERWVATERGRLAERCSSALASLAEGAEARGDHTALVRWRRRLVDADPVSSRSALSLMRALAASGDRTAALQHARIYEARVKEELGSDPDPTITRYAAELRAGVNIAPPAATRVAGDERHPAPSVSADVEDDPGETTVLASAIPDVEPAAVVTGEHPIVRHASESRFRAAAQRRFPLVPFGILIASAVIVASALFVMRRSAASVLDINRIVVVPFRTTGADSSITYLREGVVDLIAPMLTGEGGPSAVDSRTAISTWNRITRGKEGTAGDAQKVARELGAGLVLLGSVVESTDRRLTITGSIISGSTGEARPLASVSAPIDSIDSLLGRFVAQLLAQQSGVAQTSLSAVTSQSLPAIRAYLNGRAQHRRGNEELAIESFTRALDIDSTFALAALDLAVSTGKLLRTQICRNNACRIYSVVPGFSSSERSDDFFNRGIRIAWDNRARLGPRDRPLLDALRGENYPRETTARQTLAGLNRAIEAAPDRPETRYLLGVLLLYQGPALALPDSRLRAEAAFREAARLDSSYLGPLARLVDVAAVDGDMEKLHRAGLLYLSRDGAGHNSDYVRWVMAAADGDARARDRIRSRFRSLGSATLEQIFMTSQMSGFGFDDADSAANIVADSARDPFEKSVALRRAQILALNRGRPAAATDFLRRVDGLRAPSPTFRQFAAAAAIFNDGDRRVADSSIRDFSRSVARDTIGVLAPDAVRRTSAALSVAALWYLDTGDTAAAAAAMSWISRHVEGQPRNRVLSVLSEMLVASRARRSNGKALRALVDSATLDGCCLLPDFVPIALARAYEMSGDDVGALRIIRRGMWYQPPRGLSTYLRDEGRLAERTGDRAAAIRAYERYLLLRSNPEPVLRPERDSIRAELNRLKGVR